MKFFDSKKIASSTLEILLAAALFSLLALAVAGALVEGSRNQIVYGQKYKALRLAEECWQASASIAAADFLGLNSGNHGIVIVGGYWQLSGSSDINDIYERQLTISDIGTTTKQIICSVSWSDISSSTRSVSLESRLSDWRR